MKGDGGFRHGIGKARIERSPPAVVPSERIGRVVLDFPTAPSPPGSVALHKGGITTPGQRSRPLLTISGWVLDQDGQPVPAIEVSASVRRRLEAEDVGALEFDGFEPGTVTDEHGFFDLGGLQAGEYDVRAADGERTAYALLRAGVDSAVLILERGHEEAEFALVHGVVRDPDGEALAAVDVLASGQGTGRVSSDASGRYELSVPLQGRNRSYLLRFLRDGYRERRLTLADADLRSSGELEIDVVLEPVTELATVAGVVTDPNGHPIYNASVQLYSASLGRSHRTASARRGEFFLADVDVAPDYRLWVAPRNQDARRGRFKSYREEGVAVPPSGLDLAVVLEPLDEGTLDGRLINLDGRPLANFTLWLQPSQPTRPRSLPVRADREGRFSVDGVPYGALSFVTRASPYLSVSGIELASERDTVELTLDVGIHEASGYVIDDRDQPVSGAEVSLLWSYEWQGVRSRSRRSTVADAEGYFLFTQLGPGTHTLTVEAPGYRTARIDTRVGIGRGEIPVRLQRLSP